MARLTMSPIVPAEEDTWATSRHLDINFVAQGRLLACAAASPHDC